MNDVGKPCARDPHARFDRGPLAKRDTRSDARETEGQRAVPPGTPNNQRPTSPAEPHCDETGTHKKTAEGANLPT